jgi:hypothetical protein
MGNDFDIPPNTKELDNALNEIHSNLIKPKKDVSKDNKEYLKKVMCVHFKLFCFSFNLMPYTYCMLLCGH